MSYPLLVTGGRKSQQTLAARGEGGEKGDQAGKTRPRAYNARLITQIWLWPRIAGRRWGGSITTLWRARQRIAPPDGRELFYMNGTAMMAVAVETRGTTYVAGKPQLLFDGPFDTTQDINSDISPDGTRFVMVDADPDARPTRLQIVLNWLQELRPLVSATGQ
jgi:hypothetical protein